MYIWSIIGTIFCLWALKQIKDVYISDLDKYLYQEKAMKVVTFAHFFLLDFLINILYTFLFASIWFLIVTDADNQSALAGTTLDSVKDAAGFVDPLQSDVTRVHVIATPDPNPLKGLHATLVAETGATDPGSAGTTFSIVSIGFFWLIKTYLIIIVFSYARGLVIRSHLSALSFSLKSGLWDKAQRWMLSSGYWKEDEDDYKQTSHRVVS